MAKACQLCGKRVSVGHNISKAHNLTKRKFIPNLHTVTVRIDNKIKKMKLCTRCLRSNKIEKIVNVPKATIND